MTRDILRLLSRTSMDLSRKLTRITQSSRFRRITANRLEARLDLKICRRRAPTLAWLGKTTQEMKSLASPETHRNRPMCSAPGFTPRTRQCLQSMSDLLSEPARFSPTTIKLVSLWLRACGLSKQNQISRPTSAAWQPMSPSRRIELSQESH